MSFDFIAFATHHIRSTSCLKFQGHDNNVLIFLAMKVVSFHDGYYEKCKPNKVENWSGFLTEYLIDQLGFRYTRSPYGVDSV